MNKEQQEILGVVYRNYLIEDAKILPNMSKEKMTEFGYRLTQKEFINKCKTNTEFSEKWGLKIEERGLSIVERMEYYGKHYMKEGEAKSFDELLKVDYDKLNIPTKITTITYNNETVESYE